MTTPRLMLVTDQRHSVLPLPDLVGEAVAGGVDTIQIREKSLATADLLRLAEKIIARVGTRAMVVINSEIEVATCLGTGLHLPENQEQWIQAREQLGPGALIGRSVHSPQAAAYSAGVDYLIAGHVFETCSKGDLPPIGIDRFREIVTAVQVPVLAIGGITPDNISSVMNAGASGVAVMGPFARSRNPRALAESFLKELTRS